MKEVRRRLVGAAITVDLYLTLQDCCTNAQTRETSPFSWSPVYQTAFQRFKDLLASPSVLVYPSRWEVASSGLCPVNQSLSKSENNYGITELEALGAVWGAKHFRVFTYKLFYSQIQCTTSFWEVS